MWGRGAAAFSMAAVELAASVKSFAGTPILRGVSRNIVDGEFLTLVGPSSCVLIGETDVVHTHDDSPRFARLQGRHGRPCLSAGPLPSARTPRQMGAKVRPRLRSALPLATRQSATAHLIQHKAVARVLSRCASPMHKRRQPENSLMPRLKVAPKRSPCRAQAARLFRLPVNASVRLGAPRALSRPRERVC
jgi:hypothetical protein